ncbi:hypothetical protein [Sphingomonas sp. 1185]|uniref:hypothetical protein n=1 Tax=Sphingomonas sp. 1185 TaxID=3156411 RepID=UPI003399607A
MSDEEDLVTDLGEASPLEPLRASDWFWHPWYAKVWWAAIASYWVGRAASLKAPMLAPFFATFVANCLALICNPFILFLFLGFGFVRGKLDRGDWILGPEAPHWHPRRPGEMLDPTLDPSDPRSGVRHLRHIGVLKDGIH